jgi:hypothetical protein
MPVLSWFSDARRLARWVLQMQRELERVLKQMNDMVRISLAALLLVFDNAAAVVVLVFIIYISACAAKMIQALVRYALV